MYRGARADREDPIATLMRTVRRAAATKGSRTEGTSSAQTPSDDLVTKSRIASIHVPKEDVAAAKLRTTAGRSSDGGNAATSVLIDTRGRGAEKRSAKDSPGGRAVAAAAERRNAAKASAGRDRSGGAVEADAMHLGKRERPLDGGGGC